MVDLARGIPILQAWAQANPLVRYMAIFGSYAKSTARPESDLDIALDICAADGDVDAITTFTCSSEKWKTELESLLTHTHVHLSPLVDVAEGLKEACVPVYERPREDIDFSNLIAVDDLDALYQVLGRAGWSQRDRQRRSRQG